MKVQYFELVRGDIKPLRKGFSPAGTIVIDPEFEVRVEPSAVPGWSMIWIGQHHLRAVMNENAEAVAEAVRTKLGQSPQKPADIARGWKRHTVTALQAAIIQDCVSVMRCADVGGELVLFIEKGVHHLRPLDDDELITLIRELDDNCFDRTASHYRRIAADLGLDIDGEEVPA
jgi:hypothetical protein